jgi:hypothetical protein
LKIQIIYANNKSFERQIIRFCPGNCGINEKSREDSTYIVNYKKVGFGKYY